MRVSVHKFRSALNVPLFVVAMSAVLVGSYFVGQRAGRRGL